MYASSPLYPVTLANVPGRTRGMTPNTIVARACTPSSSRKTGRLAWSVPPYADVWVVIVVLLLHPRGASAAVPAASPG